MEREKPILKLLALREASEKSEKGNLGKFEFDAIMEIIMPAMATGTEVSALKRELLGVRKVACARVESLCARFAADG